MIFFILHLYFFELGWKYKLISATVIGTIYFIYNFGTLVYFGQCPMCFGEEMCNSLKNKDININLFSILLLIVNSSFSKTVLYGKLNDTDIVLKKMGAGSTNLPFDEPKIKNLSPVGNIAHEISFNIENPLKSVILCPSTAHFTKLLESVRKTNLNFEKAALWMDIKLSIEPILLQFLPQDEGWPVPQYLGACGDYIMEEFMGNSIITTYSYPWQARAYLAHQLLKAAEMFTFQHPDFVFYFTDLSPDNIVVDSSGKISLIDLDNVVILDKNPSDSEKAMNWTDIHKSESFLDGQFTFSTADLCSHHVSDHNYYAVCQHLLENSELMAGGLLHDVPLSLLTTYPKLRFLLAQCSRPTEFVDRITPGLQLKRLLENIIKDYQWSE